MAVAGFCTLLNPSARAGAGAECTPPQLLFMGKPLCASDRTVSAEEQAALLRGQVWRLMLEHRFGPAALEPSDEEVAAARHAQDKNIEDAYQRDLKIHATAQDLLARHEYSTENKRMLEQLRDAAAKGIMLYEQRMQRRAALPPGFAAEVEGAGDIALTALRGWKMDALLYKAYGGSMYRMPGGGVPVPLDAYRRFLAEQLPDLQTHDTALGDIFAAITQSDESLLESMEVEQAQAYFESASSVFAMDGDRRGALEAEDLMRRVPILQRSD